MSGLTCPTCWAFKEMSVGVKPISQRENTFRFMVDVGFLFPLNG